MSSIRTSVEFDFGGDGAIPSASSTTTALIVSMPILSTNA